MLAVVVVVVAVLLPLAAAQQTMQFSSCASGAYAANSTYEANLAVLAAALPGNASTAAAAGYATATVGAVPDQVSALALCRGDANATACRACVAASFRVARRDCPSSKDATTYQDGCIVRFSDQRFLDFVGVNSPVSELYSDADSNITAVPVAWFNAAVVALMNATVDTAVAAGSGSNNTKKYFATAVEDFDPKHYPKIYGMAQCAPVMTAAQCRSCLGGFVSSIPWFLNGKPGGRVLGIWCNLRYSVKPFYQGQPMLQISAPPEPPPPAMPSLAAPPTRTRRRRVAGISAGVACFVVLMLILSAYAFIRFKRKKAAKKDNLKKMARGKCTIFDLATLKEATENFSEKHKLGEGGFGTVYKVLFLMRKSLFQGKLPDGQEIAVKKLIESCGHGLNQLHNEVLVLAELQHKNLVRLQGFCVHKDEMLLVYEYIKNGSLDNFLFHASRGNALSWDQQYNIIFGIAKGIMYLHEDSSIRIIHRDLKANNILLDEDMDPKIADFGLARLIGGGHTHTKTTRIVGTGYMAPEYAIHGNVSPKIDIFSFGVLVLEIVTKRKNCSYGDGTTDTVNLLSDVIDQSLEGHFRNQALRCIHIGLLCVQSDPDDRPDIPSVIFMLTRDNMELQPPTEPAFFFNGNSNSASQTSDQRVYVYDRSGKIYEEDISANGITLTDIYPR
uniref:Serine/threonine kinase receptor-like protein n=1 Tax=Oryza sativa subsp. japonica TaxID=39947 RepID=Q84SG8_ORYSJ|nr:serine/threonine kinase receptor precursor-like protein [Oryza sativa Japonica Group]BAD31721.1 serine/threonine kinase receptor precursor-like protein [Oryza sativa Japonica Group]